MLGENLKNIRKAKGLSQEELAVKLNVVRQTISKWEKGISVPDSEMLIEIANTLETPVFTLLGETAGLQEPPDTIQSLSEKLTLVNEQLAKHAEQKRKAARIVSLAALVVAAAFLILQAISAFSVMPVENAGISVIGGADGPTAIFVAASVNVPGVLVAAAVIVAAVSAICLTRKK